MKVSLKVLILSASIGGGHQANAKVLQDEILNINDADTVKAVDALGCVSSVSRT